jgi:hypothetical protein
MPAASAAPDTAWQLRVDRLDEGPFELPVLCKLPVVPGQFVSIQAPCTFVLVILATCSLATFTQLQAFQASAVGPERSPSLQLL